MRDRAVTAFDRHLTNPPIWTLAKGAIESEFLSNYCGNYCEVVSPYAFLLSGLPHEEKPTANLVPFVFLGNEHPTEHDRRAAPDYISSFV